MKTKGTHNKWKENKPDTATGSYRIKNKALLLLPPLIAAFVSCTKIQGTIESTGDALGAWTLAPDKCMTGDRERIVGAALYAIKDPNVWVKISRDMRNQLLITVAIPSTCEKDGTCQALLIDRSRCSALSGDVRLTNVMTPDDFHHADGFLSMDCAVSIGAKKSRIKGEVRFTNCD